MRESVTDTGNASAVTRESIRLLPTRSAECLKRFVSRGDDSNAERHDDVNHYERLISAARRRLEKIPRVDLRCSENIQKPLAVTRDSTIYRDRVGPRVRRRSFFWGHNETLPPKCNSYNISTPQVLQQCWTVILYFVCDKNDCLPRHTVCDRYFNKHLVSILTPLIA